MEKDYEYLRAKLDASMNRNIRSDDVLNNPDRDITSIIIECYTNLNDTFLAGYSIDVIDQKGQFALEWKEDLQKVPEKLKPFLNTADINNMENSYYELKLLYIIRPDIVRDDYKLSAIDNTVTNFYEKTKHLQFKNTTLVEELKRRRKFYHECEWIRTKDIVTDKEGTYDLFIKEQSVIIPMIHKSGKYNIDGYNYYGVYNEAKGSTFTRDGKFSFKITRRGKGGAYYIKVNKYKENKNEIMYLDTVHYGHVVNPFFVLCNGKVVDNLQTDIIPYTGVKAFDEILDNTYKKALELEANGERPSSKIVQRFQKNEIAFKDEYVGYIKEYANSLDPNGFPIPKTGNKEMIHLSKFDEDVYSVINNERRKISTKRLIPSDATKRKNLSPMIINTTIKQGYTSKSKNRTKMFESSTTAPNPIDIFKLFQYIKVSQHAETRAKPKSKASNNRKSIEEQLIRYGNMKYLGTFAPKGNNDMESSLVMSFDTSGENLVSRNRRFEEIYVPNLEEYGE